MPQTGSSRVREVETVAVLASARGKVEGPKKATRGRVEWEPIKIPRGNSAYVSRSIQHVFLLT
jgi:hypothetical protein